MKTLAEITRLVADALLDSDDVQQAEIIQGENGVIGLEIEGVSELFFVEVTLA